jgi:hypothetical protein
MQKSAHNLEYIILFPPYKLQFILYITLLFIYFHNSILKSIEMKM